MVDIVGLTRFLAVVLAYFLIVCLTGIRRGGQPLLPWLLLILAQAASLYFHKEVCAFAQGVPFLAGQSEKIVQVIAIAVLAVANLLLILLMSAAGASNWGRTGEEWDGTWDEEATFENKVSSGLLNDLRESAQVQSVQSVGPSQPELADLGRTVSQDSAQMGKLELEEEDTRIFDSIQELIGTGDYDAAVKYLKTIVFFGKKESLVKKADQMLRDLQGGREIGMSP